jgi:hypothetical protein
MKEIYIEGLTIHGGLELCVGTREGAGEALAGHTQAGLLSREMGLTPGCRRCLKGGRQHCRQRYREPPPDPARSENPCVSGVSMRENREGPRSPAWLITGGSLRGGRGCTPDMTEHGKSDSPVVRAGRRMFVAGESPVGQFSKRDP